MNRFVTFLATFGGLMLLAGVAFSQEGGAAAGAGASALSGLIFTKYFGAGLTTVGAAYGIGKLASSALESMARQPEVAGSIQTAMIIAAALIEGFTFFALVICFL